MGRTWNVGLRPPDDPNQRHRGLYRTRPSTAQRTRQQRVPPRSPTQGHALFMEGHALSWPYLALAIGRPLTKTPLMLHRASLQRATAGEPLHVLRIQLCRTLALTETVRHPQPGQIRPYRAETEVLPPQPTRPSPRPTTATGRPLCAMSASSHSYWACRP